ncbi:MAG: hypothetical protein EAZ20_00325 [Bacteroidetes bacterium]|nr:MAG: hypothetical protein EAZ20_00325 [Bacteroidota bacterium]
MSLKHFLKRFSCLPLAFINSQYSCFLTRKKCVNKNLNKIYELRAKTGGMSRVFAMTGYFKNSDRQIHAFTLIFNNYTCSYTDLKNKFEEFIKVMAENT